MASNQNLNDIDRPRDSASDTPPPQAIVLAAGKGTRMGGDLPKVAYPVAGLPMITWIVRTCRAAGVARCIVVVGYRGQEVRRILADEPGCQFVEQRQQLGTAHATGMAEGFFSPQTPTDLFVLPGDAPLVTPETLGRLLALHRRARAAATVATAVLEDPFGYGRVIRRDDGSFDAIVEQKDASDSQRRVREINTGYYCFASDRLFDCLGRVGNLNGQGEYYLTDVPRLLLESGQTVTLMDGIAPQEIMGINDMKQLNEVGQILEQRLSRSGQALNPPKEPK